MTGLTSKYDEANLTLIIFCRYSSICAKLNKSTYERWYRGADEGAGTEFTEDEDPE